MPFASEKPSRRRFPARVLYDLLHPCRLKSPLPQPLQESHGLEVGQGHNACSFEGGKSMVMVVHLRRAQVYVVAEPRRIALHIALDLILMVCRPG